MLARPAELVDQVVQDRPRGGDSGRGIAAAEAIERVGPAWLSLIPEAARRLAYEAEQERGDA